MQAVVQLQVNVLGEAPGTDTAPEGPGPRVQAQVGLEVARVAEAFVAHLPRMGTGVSSAHVAGSRSLLPLPTLDTPPHTTTTTTSLCLPRPMISPGTHSVWHIGARQTWVSIMILTPCVTSHR